MCFPCNVAKYLQQEQNNRCSDKWDTHTESYDGQDLLAQIAM